MSSEPLAALEEVAAVLDRLSIPFVVGGSLASGAWGEPRSTHDVDILARLDPESIRPLVDALAGRFYVDESAVADAVRSAAAFNLIHLETFQKVDVFVAGGGALDQAQLARATVRPLSPSSRRSYPLTAPEILVLRKLDWYRRGNEASDRQWRDVLAVMRVQRGRLDLDTMEELAAGEGLDDLLRRALADAYGER